MEHENRQTAAFFDVDGTVTRTTIAHYYVDFVTRGMPHHRRMLWLIRFVPMAVYYLILDHLSRKAFVTSFYKGYRNVRKEELDRYFEESFEMFTRKRIYQGAREAIRIHQEAGHRVVFVSGGLEARVRPLARHLGVGDLIATRLEVKEGLCTGRIVGEPIVDEEKVGQVRAFAQEHSVDLSESYAYGDSRSDLPVLESVGKPVAVGRGLQRTARKRGWQAEIWCTGKKP